MKIADTISVNPGKDTLGQKSLPSAGIFRTRVIEQQNEAPTDLLSIVYPSTGAGIAEFKKYALPFRALFASILIIAGLTSLQSISVGLGLSLGIVELVLGASLAVGFLTRPLMGCAGIFFGIMSALSIKAGLTDISTLCLMFGSFLFCALGSGKYSVDFLLRNAIRRRSIKRTSQNRKNAMGYKVFHYAKY